MSPPSPNPPALISDDPGADFERAQHDMVDVFGEPGVIDKTGPSLGIAFSDQLLHCWDLARATHQDATMPEGLAEAAYSMIHGRFTDEQRKGLFKPAIDVPDDQRHRKRSCSHNRSVSGSPGARVRVEGCSEGAGAGADVDAGVSSCCRLPRVRRAASLRRQLRQTAPWPPLSWSSSGRHGFDRTDRPRVA